MPPWWVGDCDLTNYSATTGINSYRLGANFDGLVACGPRPNTYPDTSPVNPGPRVYFFGTDSVGAIEWQCVELAKRYLYQKYGIAPYYGNGKDVVNNIPQQYIGTLFEKIWNGAANKAPALGDVMSFGATTTYGHVAVVTSSSVDTNGNGQIGIIEQNWADSGYRSLRITNWRVDGPMPVTNWLHNIRTTKIAFSSNRDGNYEIYTMNPDGTGQSRLTYDPGNDTRPAWHPNGTHIAFVRQVNGVSRIYQMNADGSGQVPITNNTNWNNFDPSWSPDGSKIVFVSDRDGEDKEEIYIMNSDGSGQIRLTNNSRPDWWPDWSPDGTRIVFWSYRDSWDGEIYVMNADGSNQTRLTYSTFDDWSPNWSPDGNKIAFTSERVAEAAIFVMSVNGTNQSNLSNNNAWEWVPTWSPTGNQIAFTTNIDGNWEIYAMNSDGTNWIRLDK